MKLFLLALLLVCVLTGTASDHIIVTPTSVGIASSQLFKVSIPNENDVPIISLRLVLPIGLKDVSPSIVPGWRVETKNSGTGGNSTLTEVLWSGGQIPSGQRADFTFSAQVPATATTLAWKAYQTQSNGLIVAWDQTPEQARAGDESFKPYSQTSVVNDLAPLKLAGATNNSMLTVLAFGMSGIALLLSAFAALRKK